MIRLANDCKVDRVLIQPYLKGEGQGYKNYEEQAIHLTTHPEYREFITLLSQYKDEPVLYTYIDLPGFDSKISKDVEIQKAFVCYLRADEFLKLNQPDAALSYVQESITLSPREYSYYKLWEILKVLGKPEEAEEAFQIAEQMRIEMEQK